MSGVLSSNKTKIVCTIGPASQSVDVLKRMISAGMNVARLNLSHGTPEYHALSIKNIRLAASELGVTVALMADLPGPKMRVGIFSCGSVDLKPGDRFILTCDDVEGSRERVSVSFKALPSVVVPGNILFLNDGFIQLEVKRISGNDVVCQVSVGGTLSSKKGLNIPGVELGIRAFTEDDRVWLRFAAEERIDAVSQSFVESAEDIADLRCAAEELGYSPFVIAKIERDRALGNIDEIIRVSDGIMIARGDLGVEVPIERIAIIQRKLTEKAFIAGKPVITATQMLESMAENSRPTRAEATDVANAVFYGTDAVMLSGESAVGRYPIEAVKMLSAICRAAEPERRRYPLQELIDTYESRIEDVTLKDLIVLGVEAVLTRIDPVFILVPTMTGDTARNISRFRPQQWILAVSPDAAVCAALQFSYGVYALFNAYYIEDKKAFASRFARDNSIAVDKIVLIEGPSSVHPDAAHRLEIIELRI